MKAVKGILATSIALGTILGMTATAFADTGTASTTSPTTNSTSTGDSSTSSLNTSVVTPDSYLYFTTQVTQAIDVSLAGSDFQQAQLLAQYGQQEVTAANKLLQTGQTDAADTLMSQAVNDQLLAVDTTNTASQSGQASTNDVAGIKNEVADSVVALSQALQNVSNPTAKTELEKNVERSFTQLQEQLVKIGTKATSDVAESSDTKETSADSSAQGSDAKSSDNQGDSTDAQNVSSKTKDSKENQDQQSSNSQSQDNAQSEDNQTQQSTLSTSNATMQNNETQTTDTEKSNDSPNQDSTDGTDNNTDTQNQSQGDNQTQQSTNNTDGSDN